MKREKARFGGLFCARKLLILRCCCAAQSKVDGKTKYRLTRTEFRFIVRSTVHRPGAETMNSNLKREQNLRKLRSAAQHLLPTERAELEAAISDYAALAEQDQKLRAMLARWEQQYGPKDNCVRALKAVLGDVA